MLATGGTLGDLSITKQAKAEEYHFDVDNLPEKQRAAWVAVEEYRKTNPTASVEGACKLLGHNWANYYAAKKKVVASEKQAFGDFSSKDMIRPGDKCLETNGTVIDEAPPKRRGRKPRAELVLAQEPPPELPEPTVDEPQAEETFTEKDVLYRVIENLEALDNKESRERVIRAACVFLSLEE